MFKVGDIVYGTTISGKHVYAEVTEIRHKNCMVIKSVQGKHNLRMVVSTSDWTLERSYHRKNKLLKLKEKLNG